MLSRLSHLLKIRSYPVVGIGKHKRKRNDSWEYKNGGSSAVPLVPSAVCWVFAKALFERLYYRRNKDITAQQCKFKEIRRDHSLTISFF